MTGININNIPNNMDMNVIGNERPDEEENRRDPNQRRGGITLQLP